MEHFKLYCSKVQGMGRFILHEVYQEAGTILVCIGQDGC